MLLLGLGTSGLIAWLAYRKQSLSESGFWGALLVGTLIMGYGGWLWFGLLLTFFISGSALSHYYQEQKQVVEVNYAKTGRRDFWQTVANGGLGAGLAVASRLFLDTGLAFSIFLGVMATVTADTWASEVGVLSKTAPRSLVTGQVVAPGTSGGVTLLGTGAALVGSLVVGMVGWLGLRWGGSSTTLRNLVPVMALVGGMVGCFADSIFGALWQVMYRCPVCGAITEGRTHCGVSAVWWRGWGWLTNDVVNFSASLLGGLVAGLMYWVVSP